MHAGVGVLMAGTGYSSWQEKAFAEVLAELRQQTAHLATIIRQQEEVIQAARGKHEPVAQGSTVETPMAVRPEPAKGGGGSHPQRGGRR